MLPTLKAIFSNTLLLLVESRAAAQEFIMFGFGRFSKKLFRNTTNKFHEFHSENESVEFYKQIEAGTSPIDYFIDLVPEYKLIYYHVPKAASTSIKTILMRANGIEPDTIHQAHRRKYSKLLSPRQYGYDNFYRLMRDPEATIMVVSRHPLSRLKSCYRDKFAPYDFSEKNNIFNEARQYLNMSEVRSIVPGTPLSFDLFVKMACRSCSFKVNGHWSAMSNFVPVNRMRFTHVGKVEHIEETYELLRQIGIPENAFLIEKQNRTSASAVDTTITEELSHLINGAYYEDFKYFGYEFVTASTNK